MKFADWIMIAAILCGPVLAVQAQKWIETAREKRNRRLNVFKRLMATRGAVLSPGHVEALNMIDLEFAGRGRRNEQVRRRWREYLDHLGSLTQDPEEQARNLPVWTERSGNLLADLLHDMGMAVGYDFDRVQIRRGIYIPMGHANFEMETQLLRRLLIQLLVGERSLPLEVRSLPSVRQNWSQQLLQSILLTPSNVTYKHWSQQLIRSLLLMLTPSNVTYKNWSQQLLRKQEKTKRVSSAHNLTGQRVRIASA
jgi:hypothetical protein